MPQRKRIPGAPGAVGDAAPTQQPLPAFQGLEVNPTLVNPANLPTGRPRPQPAPGNPLIPNVQQAPPGTGGIDFPPVPQTGGIDPLPLPPTGGIDPPPTSPRTGGIDFRAGPPTGGIDPLPLPPTGGIDNAAFNRSEFPGQGTPQGVPFGTGGIDPAPNPGGTNRLPFFPTPPGSRPGGVQTGGVDPPPIQSLARFVEGLGGNIESGPAPVGGAGADPLAQFGGFPFGARQPLFDDAPIKGVIPPGVNIGPIPPVTGPTRPPTARFPLPPGGSPGTGGLEPGPGGSIPAPHIPGPGGGAGGGGGGGGGGTGSPIPQPPSAFTQGGLVGPTIGPTQGGLSGEISSALSALLGSQGGALSPFGQNVEQGIIDLLGSGGNFDPSVVGGRLETVREELDRQRSSQLDSLQSALAARGLSGSGPEVGGRESIERNIASQFAGALRDITSNEQSAANNRFAQALGFGAGLTGQQQGNLANAVQAGTGRQNVLSQIALQNLAQQQDFAKFLAQFGLDRALVMEQIQQGRITSLLPILQLLFQGAGQSAQGFIGR